MQSEVSLRSNLKDQYLPARQVWQRYGVTSMTIHRWLVDDRLGFPKPIRIRKMRYWHLADLETWDRANSGREVHENRSENSA